MRLDVSGFVGNDFAGAYTHAESATASHSGPVPADWSPPNDDRPPTLRERDTMTDYPRSITEINHVAPAPRRVRGIAGGDVLFDTTRALYVWEWPHYPHYYVPLADVRSGALTPD